MHNFCTLDILIIQKLCTNEKNYKLLVMDGVAVVPFGDYSSQHPPGLRKPARAGEGHSPPPAKRITVAI